MKPPECTILLKAHRAIESLTLGSRACSPEGRSYAKICLTYLQWLLVVSEREAIQALIDQSQKFVCGRVRLKLCR